jgi:DNA-binding NarL/FixJ family response regulator
MFDDSQTILDSFSVLLSASTIINLVAIYNNADDVIKKVKACKANVVIMDIDMPGTNGIQAVKNLRISMPDVLIIMFTVFEDDDKIFNSICAGANGYLLKKTEPQKIIDAIIEVENGGAPMSPAIARRVMLKFQQTNYSTDAYEYALTIREKEVLKYLTNGLSYKMIASECEISFETVRTHIRNIYNKLHVASMTEAVAKAIKEKIV